MMSKVPKMLVMCLAAASLAGCSRGIAYEFQDAPMSESPPEDKPLAVIESPALPAAERLVYHSFSAKWAGGSTREMVDTEHQVDVSQTARGRGVRVLSDAFTSQLNLDAEGAVLADEAAYPLGHEIFAAQIPGRTRIHAGTRYVTGLPTAAYLDSVFAKGNKLLASAYFNEVESVRREGSLTVIRVLITEKQLAYSERDAAPTEFGVLTIGVADLVQAPGYGLRLLRMTQVNPAGVSDEGRRAVDKRSVHALRLIDHEELTLCLRNSSRVGEIEAILDDPRGVPEFNRCRLRAARAGQ